jgi:hypothetical protein
MNRKTEGQNRVGVPRRMLTNNIEVDHKELEEEGLDWIHYAEDTVQWRSRVITTVTFGF